MQRNPDPESPTGETAPEGQKLRTIHAFALFAAQGEHRRLAVALLLLVLGGVTEGLSIVLIIPLLSLVEPGASNIVDLPLGPVGSVEVPLLAVLALLVALVIVHAFFMRAKNIYVARLLFHIFNRVRLGMFAAIGGASWEFLSRQRRSDLHHLLTTDAERVYSAIFAMIMLVQTAVLLCIYLIVSAAISPPMTLVAMGLGSLVLVVLAPVRRRATAFGHERTVNKRNQFRTVAEFLDGMKTAKIHAMEEGYRERLARNLEAVQGEAVGYMRLTSLATIVSQAVSALAIATLVFLGIAVFETPLASLLVFLLVLARIAPRFLGIQSSLQDLLLNLPVIETIRRFEAECRASREIEALPSGVPIRLESELAFDEVGYRYPGPDSPPVLQGVSLRLPAGQITAVIGPSGCGKSTLADLAAGLLLPSSGTIALDGRTLPEEDRRAWRRSVAYVPQDAFLLNASVADNLRLGCPEAEDAALWQALDQAGVDFVRGHRCGLDLIIGDNGTALSGGQRQRVALARALLRQPELLILDEATASLDWASQDAVNETLRQLRGQTTILMIAHRPSAVGIADWIVAMEAGTIVECGTPQDLSRRNGRLAAMLDAEGREFANPV
ncbi:ABC transporter ATP-binding protein [Aurantiacibacter poecillastricola]|uniref:ABC transporter ATP-binding protein n=1 Tax=Aurantiacibacter poecillastricola TaxID=3064385 RepID=UPI00273D6648|nr:ABC transporter ATP-binding protein [Aurantiacibacter sp. 219JJ12-13]MDP5263226.1 ABC transporter ATP-binding protein [Aurantiacibacter sp. 219JJ12-13]